MSRRLLELANAEPAFHPSMVNGKGKKRGKRMPPVQKGKASKGSPGAARGQAHAKKARVTAASAEYDQQPRSSEQTTCGVKMDAKCCYSRAYHRALQKGRKEGLCGEDAKVAARTEAAVARDTVLGRQ